MFSTDVKGVVLPGVLQWAGDISFILNMDVWAIRALQGGH